MKKLKIHKNSGETLVEIMVSAMLFLMMMAIIQGAISFCTNAQHKSREIRESNGEICNKVREGTGLPLVDNGGDKSLEFKAISADGLTTGNHVFTVETNLKKAEVEDDNGGSGRKAVFYFFKEKEGGGPP